MPSSPHSDWIFVASLSELAAKQVMVVTDSDRPIAVFHHEDRVWAVDNRCPHLGFPLHKGSVRDGLLTCHWHEARFDLSSGCTFDLWADDVPSYDTEVREGGVYVKAKPRQDLDRAYYFGRLLHGLQHSISLIQGKAILGLRKMGVGWLDILRECALFGSANHDRWGEGMTLLAVTARLLPYVENETAYFLMVRASAQLAEDCSEAAPHRKRESLGGDQTYEPGRLSQWLRSWVRARHRDAAERVLLTAAKQLRSSPEFADLLFTAASDRIYAQTGHVLDAASKACELLDGIGWEHASSILPLLSQPITSARGAEEDAHWHHPIEIIEPLREAEARLACILEEELQGSQPANGELLAILLGDDPLLILSTLESELRGRVSPLELAKLVAYAAALRLARFSLSNEVADWFNPRHTFIFANAVHQSIQRSPTPGVVRGIYHAALSVYADRFLNVPPARLPDDSRESAPQPEALCHQLLETLDRHSDVDHAAQIVAQYMRADYPIAKLIDTLGLATAREDFDFHAIQVLEAGVQQAQLWNRGPESEHILVGVVRQLAAFCPTPRASFQTAATAMRLERGDKMYDAT